MKFELVIQFTDVATTDDSTVISNILAEAISKKMGSYIQSQTIEALKKRFCEQLNSGDNKLTEGIGSAGQTCDVIFTIAKHSLELRFSDVKTLPRRDQISHLIKEIAEKFSASKVRLNVQISSVPQATTQTQQ